MGGLSAGNRSPWLVRQPISVRPRPHLSAADQPHGVRARPGGPHVVDFVILHFGRPICRAPGHYQVLVGPLGPTKRPANRVQKSTVVIPICHEPAVAKRGAAAFQPLQVNL